MRRIGLSLVLAAFAFAGLSASAVSALAQQLKQAAYIKASNAEMGDHFGNGGTLEGHGVALSADGTTLAVAAPYESSNAKGINGNQNDNSMYASGAVYVFVQRNGAWIQQAYIKASNPGVNYKFGHHIAISGDGNTLGVSSLGEASASKGINGDQNDKSIPQSGAVYVFTRNGTTWSQQAYIKASNTGELGSSEDLPPEGDLFGFSLALSTDGNTIAVGAIGEDSGAAGVNGNQNDNTTPGAGAVYVFTRNGSAWAQQAYIKAGNPVANTMFGYSVGVSGDGNTLAASSYDEGSSTRSINGPYDRERRGSGALYVFSRTGTSWAQTAFLKASNAEFMDSLGYSLAISEDGNTIAGGAADEDCEMPGVFPGATTVCGDDSKTDFSTGAAYIFVHKGGMWTQEAFLKASNPGHNDWFGSRLNISGDGNTLAVGAQLENGGAKGINGDQKNKSAEDSGAIYFFTRKDGTWTQAAYVKPDNAEAYDEFGSAMALSRNGKIMAVGARGEGSATKGINGNENDNSAPGAGAVYIFTYQ